MPMKRTRRLERKTEPNSELSKAITYLLMAEIRYRGR